jgi:glutamate-1-semialdehyde 2,1-aminomutase
MKSRNYQPLIAELAAAYRRHSPKSAALHERALESLVDGGSNALRTLRPFPPRVVEAKGAWVTDVDGHRILDYWQGHYANVLGHNPSVVTEALAQAFQEGFGLQTGFTDRLQIDVAEILCRQTDSERARFTTSGTLATMYAMMLARAFTKRELVLKVGGGWHGGHLWGLKGVGHHGGFDGVDSEGLSTGATDEVLITCFNNTDLLHEHFRQFGDKLACFILEPVIGAGGLLPATREYVQAARELTEKYGVLLIFDEVISAFRFRAGNVGRLYGVQPELTTMGKAIGGGMLVAAVVGRADIMGLAGLDSGAKVKFQGGTFAAHPASLLAAKTLLSHMVENEAEIYPRMSDIALKTRQTVANAFEEEGIYVRFAGDRIDMLRGNSLHMLLFPYEEGLDLNTPEEVRNPSVCDITLGENVLQLALLLENVFTVHGIGCTTAAHSEEDTRILGDACRRAARRIKPYR